MELNVSSDVADVNAVLSDIMTQQREMQAAIAMLRQFPPSSRDAQKDSEEKTRVNADIESMKLQLKDLQTMVHTVAEDVGSLRREQVHHNSEVQRQILHLDSETLRLKEELRLTTSNVSQVDASMRTLSDRVYGDMQRLTQSLRDVRAESEDRCRHVSSTAEAQAVQLRELEDALLAAVASLGERQHAANTALAHTAVTAFDTLTRGTGTGGPSAAAAPDALERDVKAPWSPAQPPAAAPPSPTRPAGASTSRTRRGFADSTLTSTPRLMESLNEILDTHAQARATDAAARASAAQSTTLNLNKQTVGIAAGAGDSERAGFTDTSFNNNVPTVPPRSPAPHSPRPRSARFRASDASPSSAAAPAPEEDPHAVSARALVEAYFGALAEDVRGVQRAMERAGAAQAREMTEFRAAASRDRESVASTLRKCEQLVGDEAARASKELVLIKNRLCGLERDFASDVQRIDRLLELRHREAIARSGAGDGHAEPSLRATADGRLLPNPALVHADSASASGTASGFGVATLSSPIAGRPGTGAGVDSHVDQLQRDTAALRYRLDHVSTELVQRLHGLESTMAGHPRYLESLTDKLQGQFTTNLRIFERKCEDIAISTVNKLTQVQWHTPAGAPAQYGQTRVRPGSSSGGRGGRLLTGRFGNTSSRGTEGASSQSLSLSLSQSLRIASNSRSGSTGVGDADASPRPRQSLADVLESHLAPMQAPGGDMRPTRDHAADSMADDDDMGVIRVVGSDTDYPDFVRDLGDDSGSEGLVSAPHTSKADPAADVRANTAISPRERQFPSQAPPQGRAVSSAVPRSRSLQQAPARVQAGSATIGAPAAALTRRGSQGLSRVLGASVSGALINEKRARGEKRTSEAGLTPLSKSIKNF